jgi:SAM-dependent methyltransferase
MKAWRGGLFGFQPNNSTREFEYPWAFYVAPLSSGLPVLEIGGAMSGFQFALARAGAMVSNVDPFRDYGHGPYDAEPRLVHGKLNRYFRTDVRLYPCTLAEAKLPSASFDRIFCISTIEHLDWQELCRTVKEASRLLREGGLFVLTIDLFLNLVPFTRRKRNEFGVNVSIRDLIAEAGADLVYGEKSQLYGFSEFEANDVAENLEQYLIGQGYPSLTQLLVLQKGSGGESVIRTDLFSGFRDPSVRTPSVRVTSVGARWLRRLRKGPPVSPLRAAAGSGDAT